MRKNIKDYDMRAYTHTLQMKSEECPLGLEDTNKKWYMVKPAKYGARFCTYPINVNKYALHDVTDYQEMLRLLDEIKQDLHIEHWELDRQDIAIDSTLTFDDLYKINSMLVTLFGLSRGSTNITDINGAFDLKKRQVSFMNSRYELSVYDKALESGGKYPYSRCEFRFKLIPKSKQDKCFMRLYKTLDTLPQLVDMMNGLKVEALYQQWIKESDKLCKNTPVRTLPEFFRRYGNHIFTVDIARGLHDKILNGKYEHWIKKNRKSMNIHFISKAEFTRYCQSIKRAVKRYENALPKRGHIEKIYSVDKLLKIA